MKVVHADSWANSEVALLEPSIMFNPNDDDPKVHPWYPDGQGLRHGFSVVCDDDTWRKVTHKGVAYVPLPYNWDMIDMEGCQSPA